MAWKKQGLIISSKLKPAKHTADLYAIKDRISIIPHIYTHVSSNVS